MDRRQALLVLLGVGAAGSAARASAPDPADLAALRAAARGQTVYFNAWGGEEKINAYLAWAGAELERRYGLRLVHVKLADTAEAVGRLIAEGRAGRRTGGSIDLIWINGRNFKLLKDEGLLFGPFLRALPAAAYLDLDGDPTLTRDFTVPTEGYEAPWGRARLTFYHDAARDPAPPRDLEALLAFARANPGRFTYPQPPDFLGTTFLKQVLIARAADRSVLARDPDEATYAAAAAPVFAYLDALHPHLWRGGRSFPANVAALRRLFADGEIRLAFTFNPADPAVAVMRGELPETTRAYGLAGGTLGNAHFLAIPANAQAKEGALLAIDFLLSPPAQARKADLTLWGDPTVLALPRLDAAARSLFQSAAVPAYPDEAALGPALDEPHPGWTPRLEAEWRRRYGG